MIGRNEQGRFVVEGPAGKVVIDCSGRQGPALSILNTAGKALAILDGNGVNFYEENGDWLVSLGVERNLDVSACAELRLRSPMVNQPTWAQKEVAICASPIAVSIVMHRTTAPGVVRLEVDDRSGRVGAQWGSSSGLIATGGSRKAAEFRLEADEGQVWEKSLEGR